MCGTESHVDRIARRRIATQSLCDLEYLFEEVEQRSSALTRRIATLLRSNGEVSPNSVIVIGGAL